jgi:hypothetical protein
MDHHEQRSHGLPCSTGSRYLGNRTLLQLIDGILDDTSPFIHLLGLLGDPNDIHLRTDNLRQDVLLWKQLLEASGDKLELQK